MVSELNMLHGWRVSEADSSRLCSPTFLSLIACPRGFQSAYLLHCFSVARCGYTDTVIKCFLTVGNPYEELSEVVLFLDTEACSPLSIEWLIVDHFLWLTHFTNTALLSMRQLFGGLSHFLSMCICLSWSSIYEESQEQIFADSGCLLSLHARE
jgi:hypothetical protein